MRIPALLSAILATLTLSACATTPSPAASPQADAAERARCEKMLAMGTGAEHDHSAEKTGGMGQMSADHQHCRALLGK